MYNPSLLKVPALLLTSYWCHVNATSPTPPVQSDEKFERKYGIGDLLQVPVRLMLHSFQMFYHIIGLLELIDLIVNQRWRPMNESLTITSDGREILGLPAAFLLGVCLLGVGTLIRVSCYRALGRFFTFELSIKTEHTLITSGPYSFVRHPAYLGSLFALFGCLLTNVGPGSWWWETQMWRNIVGMVVGGMLIINGLYMFFFVLDRTGKEDAVLRAEFKGQWDAWAERTRYRVIPYVY